MNTRTLRPRFHAVVLPVVAAALVAIGGDGHAASAATDQAAATKQASGKKAESTPYRALRASKIIGKEVRNPEGKNIGQIRDLIVNMNNGQVRYAMLEFDPGIFQGERLFAVPTTQLRLGSDDQLVYNMTRDKLEQAAVPRADWNKAWHDHDYLGRMDKVWGVTQPSNDERAYRVSDLLGKDVNSPSGKDIGDLKDLVINMATQKVHYAVLAFDPSWTAPEKNFAFPLSAFNLTADKDELVLDVDKAKIQAMKSFDDSRLANLNDPVWVADVDRYFVTILPVVVAVKPEDIFARLDADKNGSLDKTEVKASADVERNWTRLDTDKNGRISKSEFTSQYTADAGSPAAKKTGS